MFMIKDANLKQTSFHLNWTCALGSLSYFNLKEIIAIGSHILSATAMTNTTDFLRVDGRVMFYEELAALAKFIYHIWICIVIFGLTSNTINIIVFLKTGLKDNVTITLLFLSVSDLINLCLNCPIVVGRFMLTNIPYHPWPFHHLIITFGPYWYAYVFYDYSSFISVFLAVVRCACVARPLRFKSMFTKSRTITILCVLFLVALTLRIPVLTVFGLTWSINPKTNATYRSLSFADNIEQIYTANDIINRNIISWLAYTIVTTCVVILTNRIRAASRFRRSLALRPDSRDVQAERDKTSGQISGYHESHGQSSSTPDTERARSGQSERRPEKMSAKDLQVIQSVTLICVIFIFSQLPFQILSTVRLFDPEFSNYGKRQSLYGFMSHISNTCGFLNVSINILVHFHFNSKYREQFVGLFSGRLNKKVLQNKGRQTILFWPCQFSRELNLMAIFNHWKSAVI